MITALLIITLCSSLFGRHGGAWAIISLTVMIIWLFIKLIVISCQAMAWVFSLPLCLLGINVCGHKRIG